MRYVNEQVISAADVSQDHNSIIVPSSTLYRVSAQIVATGSPNAMVVIQVSNDVLSGAAMNTGSFVPTNWSDLGSPVAVASTAPVLIPAVEICYEWVRVVITGGGTGTVTATLQALGF